jgi:hypothetical protein
LLLEDLDLSLSLSLPPLLLLFEEDELLVLLDFGFDVLSSSMMESSASRSDIPPAFDFGLLLRGSRPPVKLPLECWPDLCPPSEGAPARFDNPLILCSGEIHKSKKRFPSKCQRLRKTRESLFLSEFRVDAHRVDHNTDPRSFKLV